MGRLVLTAEAESVSGRVRSQSGNRPVGVLRHHWVSEGARLGGGGGMTITGNVSQFVVVPVRFTAADEATVLVTSLETQVTASTSVCGSFAESGCRSGRPMNARSTFKLASRPIATAIRNDRLPHSCEVSACNPLSKLSLG